MGVDFRIVNSADDDFVASNFNRIPIPSQDDDAGLFKVGEKIVDFAAPPLVVSADVVDGMVLRQLVNQGVAVVGEVGVVKNVPAKEYGIRTGCRYCLHQLPLVFSVQAVVQIGYEGQGHVTDNFFAWDCILHGFKSAVEGEGKERT